MFLGVGVDCVCCVYLLCLLHVAPVVCVYFGVRVVLCGHFVAVHLLWCVHYFCLGFVLVVVCWLFGALVCLCCLQLRLACVGLVVGVVSVLCGCYS